MTTSSLELLAQAWAVVNEWERDAGCPPTPFCPPFDPDLRLISRNHYWPFT